MHDEHQLCEDPYCHRRECRQNRQDTERGHRWENRVTRVRPNRTDRRRAPASMARRFTYGGDR